MTRDDEARLLDQIRANPLDDRARSVYADLLSARGDERGEYIELALEPSRQHWDATKIARWDELRRREKAWAAELGLGAFEHLGWYRGLPGHLTATVELVVQHAEALGQFPITSLTFWSETTRLATLAAQPVLATVEDLILGHPRADDLRVLATSPHAGSLRTLACTHLTDDAAAALGAAPWLAQLARLTIQESIDLTGAGVATLLCASLPCLTDLGILQASLGEQGARAIAEASLPSLDRLTCIQTKLRDHARHVLGTRTRYLHIGNDDLHEGAFATLRNDHVRQLALPLCQIDDRAAAALAASSFPNLEALTLNANKLERAALVALAGATGMPSLRELVLDDNPLTTGQTRYVEFSDESDGVSGDYAVRIPREEIAALFAHRPELRVKS